MSQFAADISDFEGSLNTHLVTAVQTVVDASHNRMLSREQVIVLREAIVSAYADELGDTPVDDPGYGATFDMTSEINEQIRLIRKLRAKLDKADVSPKDIHDTLKTTNQVLAQLFKYHEKLVDQKVTQGIQEAVIEAVKGLDREVQDRFFSELTRLLPKAVDNGHTETPTELD